MEALRGKFYIQGEFKEKYVVVDDGIIRGIRDELSGYDVTTLPYLVLPGGVDIHVHFREPGETYKEDFASGSTSAIFGGTTTVCDMPNNLIPITDSKSFNDKLNAVNGKSYVDFGLYQAASGEIVPEAIGQKVFMGKTTGGMLTNMERSLFSDKMKAVHAELQSCLDRFGIDDVNLLTHDKSRPLECEMEALEQLFSYKLSKVHAAHLTSMRTLELAKKLGFTTELTPHHILLNNSMDIGAHGKVNPPLRKKSVQQEILMNLGSRFIDVISSDHAPHARSEKGDFEGSPSGIPGVETRLPLILGLFRKGLISMEKAISALSEKPAEIAGINKGYIAEGFDADFIVVDIKEERKIMAETLHSKSDWTPFEGFDAIFPEMVFLGGVPVVQQNEIISGARGRFVNGKNE